MKGARNVRREEETRRGEWKETDKSEEGRFVLNT